MMMQKHMCARYAFAEIFCSMRRSFTQEAPVFVSDISWWKEKALKSDRLIKSEKARIKDKTSYFFFLVHNMQKSR